MARHNAWGSRGEDIACDMLVAKGYSICERNWRSGHYEIDIVAMKDGRIVFVEVKTRTDRDTDPASAVDRKKIMRLVRAADCYIRAYDIPHEFQFDIITVSGTESDYEIEHIPDAFLPPLNSRR